MIKKIEKVTCSLSLGYIYNLNYSFVPKEGAKITLFFVSESGTYDLNFLSSDQKATIKIGRATFNMYPVRLKEGKTGTQKTLSVDFIDDTFKLGNYYISLTNKGCGKNVFQLGSSVDKRTEAQKEAEDGDLFKIKEFTSFDDVEYSFGDFVNTLKKVFPVEIKCEVDNTITRPFEGTFAEVLGSWCSYFNLSYFFENGTIKIFDPVSMNITFPSVPNDAIESSYEESIENTYDKTVWSSFLDEGREIELGGFSSNNYYIKGITLFPWEDIFELKRLNDDQNGIIEKNQLAAAQYGKEFWFLYNYYKGTHGEECGFGPERSESVINFSSYLKSFVSSTAETSFFNLDIFEKKYQKYYNYGRNIAGRYYITSEKYDNISDLMKYSWYDCTTSAPATIDELKEKPSVSLNIFSNPVGDSYGILGGTEIQGSDFRGILIEGSRVYVVDDSSRDYDSFFEISEDLKQKISTKYRKITEGVANVNVDFQDGAKNIVIHEEVILDDDIIDLINEISTKTSIFEYKKIETNSQNIFIRGYYSPSAPVDDEDPNLPFDDTDISIIDSGPQVNSNSSVIKAAKNYSYVAYYPKYSSCIHSSTSTGGLTRRFESLSPSIDISTPIDVITDSKGVVTINRNLNYINEYQNSGIINKIAKAFTIKEKKLEFTLNYFYNDIPTNFLSNGLVGLSVSVSENGLTATYSFSNEVIRVDYSQNFIEKLEKSIKNSYIRNYIPVKTKTV